MQAISGNELEAEGDGETASGQVDKVKQSWREHEDFGLAYRMQNNEFSQHYEKNRFERRLMHSDICLTKDEQRSEDGYAAAYREQVRRDQMKEDERLALELQKRIDDEERRVRLAKEQEDWMLAKRLQDLDVNETKIASRELNAKDAGDRLDANLFGGGIRKSSSGNRLTLPPGITPELVKALEEANETETIALPPGVTPEQYYALQKAAIEEDRRLAEEVQDYELARFVERKEKPKASNCLKPSQLLALAEGKRPSASKTDSRNGQFISFDERVQYSVISKKPKNKLTQGSQERHRDKDVPGQRWEQFE